MGLLGADARLRFGGAGWVLLGTTAVPSGNPGSPYELRFAYGGLVGELVLVETERGALSLRTLIGAGNAKVTSVPIMTTLIGADNFGVFEPELAGAWRLHRGLHITAAAGYRFTFGVEDLPGVSPSDLRGPSLRTGLAIRTY